MKIYSILLMLVVLAAAESATEDYFSGDVQLEATISAEMSK